MIAATIFFIAALVLAVLFWVWVVRALLAKIYKTPFGKKNVVSLLLFGTGGWVCFFVGVGVSVAWFAAGGYEKAAEKSAYVAAVTRESARKGWSKGLLKKLDALDFSLDRVQLVEDELSLTSSALRTYEATLVVDNRSSEPNITYKELRRASLAYAEDESGVFIPAFVVNHSTLDEIPWLLRFLLPSYRREAQRQFLPSGRSYLSVRFDIAEGHTLSAIGFGEKRIAVDAAAVLPLRKDDNLSKHKSAEDDDADASGSTESGAGGGSASSADDDGTAGNADDGAGSKV